MRLKVFFFETRPQFLILSVILAFLGTTIAGYDGSFNLGYALLAGFGLVLAHVSVNTFNDYGDFRSGVDLATRRTPFSGGSGMLPEKVLKPKDVFWLALLSLVVAIAIGVYFSLAVGWELLPLLVVAGLCVVLYTPVILKTPWPEWAPGVGLGVLPVMGMYFVQAGEYNWPLVVAGVPSGILVHNLLFLNEFPDVDADRTVGRRTTPIMIGKDKAAIMYAGTTLLVYAWIVGWVIARVLPVFCLLALLTLPFGIKAIRGARHHDDMSRLGPAMAANVMVVLLTQLLLGVGFILAAIIR